MNLKHRPSELEQTFLRMLNHAGSQALQSIREGSPVLTCACGILSALQEGDVEGAQIVLDRYKERIGSK
jgi:hypothetical protein